MNAQEARQNMKSSKQTAKDIFDEEVVELTAELLDVANSFIEKASKDGEDSTKLCVKYSYTPFSNDMYNDLAKVEATCGNLAQELRSKKFYVSIYQATSLSELVVSISW